MKKTFLSGLALLGILAADAQTLLLTVNLNTGIFDNYNTTLNTWDVPVTNADDTWKVRLPLSINPSGAFSPAYVTTGRFSNSGSPDLPYNWVDTDQDITPEAHIVAPRIYMNDELFNDGDIRERSDAGEYLYRMTFEFNKTCNTSVLSANININVLAGDGITGIYLNGHPLTLPDYPQLYGHQYPGDPDFLNIFYAEQAPNTFNQYPRYNCCGGPSPYSTSGPFVTSIPQAVISVNPGYLANGTNVIVIAMDNTLPQYSSTGGPTSTSYKIQTLMIDAKLDISYTQGSPALYVTGTNVISPNQSTPIYITVGASPASNYLVQVPALGYSGTGSTTVTVMPAVSTTYTIYMTNLTTGCVDKVKWPITVVSPTAGWVSVNPNTSTDMVCPGTTGVITTELNGASPSGYTTRIAKDYFSDPFYEGSPNAEVEVSPEETTEYIIRTTDPNGDEHVISFVVEVLPTEICDEDFRSHETMQVTAAPAPGFNISPNPGNGLVQLTVTNNNPKTIEVFDVLGKRVFEKNNITEMQSVIDITAQPKGVYMVKVTDGTTVTTKRIIKE